jgi:predicted O-methyltransferase YrrM
MPFATALVAIDRPARYVKQLVSHLGHRGDTAQTADGRATIMLSSGTCVLAPGAGHLELIAASQDIEGLAAVQDVVARHLLRFAGEDSGVRVDWSPATSGAEIEPVHPAVADYVMASSTPPNEVLLQLIAETREATGGRAQMQISHDEGTLLTMLVQLVGARNAVEIGTFTGYSSICIARGLAPGGRLLACDVSEEWTSIAREYWRKAGVDERIDLKIAPAIDTLRALPGDFSIDFAFIDADKDSYPAYYEEIVRRLRPGGVIALDNVLRGGRVLDPAFTEPQHEAMRRLNARIAEDERVDAVMLPLRDGVTVVRKRVVA